MEQYIPKSVVLAEIEKRRDLHYKYYMKNGAGSIAECKYDEDKDILSLLDTLEVKEVDLEKEIKEDWLFADKTEVDCLESMCLTEDVFVSLVKKYFQIGLNAQKGE